MPYLCPVCNGLSALQATCQYCHHPLEDYGRIEQLFGPYSPYQEISDLKMTNGFIDSTIHLCIHVTYCPMCGKEHLITIKEQYQTY
ncbi:hypothetical protein [Vulcanibacillus modesticaldus]|uniref:hypothetical protein n=1 Tax=Vulcanibacillus modesticaldus TaxID=337097 RepID=UPI000A02483F|nr:hypothetical protein [Vulcanibacillus modesticaldus]